MMSEHSPFDHVKDATVWEFLFGTRLELPKLVSLDHESPFLGVHGHAGYGIYLTKFMVLEVIAALLCLALFIPAARRARGTLYPAGRLQNLIETILLFIRDQIARPSIGGHSEHGHSGESNHDSGHGDGHGGAGAGAHPADRFLPYLWTAFAFILTCNLLGMLPFGASATGALGCTGAMALCTLGTGLVSCVVRNGPIGMWHALVPPLDVPAVMKVLLVPMMFFIEAAGVLIKHTVLSIRLFANMLAGHTVLSVILGFIVAKDVLDSWWLFGLVAPASVFGVVALSLLEIFFAFLQAYIFTFLSALFIGMLVHPHH